MRLSRREFIKIAGTVAAGMGVSTIAVQKFTEQLAMATSAKAKVLWLQGQCCTGCSTSFVGLLNRNVSHTAVSYATVGGDGGNTMRTAYSDAFDAVSPGQTTPVGAGSSAIEDVLLDVIDLQYHPTLMSAGGQLAVNVLDSYCEGGANFNNGYVLVIEGSIPVTATGAIGPEACSIGYNDGTVTNINASGNITLYSALDKLINASGVGPAAVVSCGTCAAFGGIPASANGSDYDSSGAASASTVLSSLGYTGPVVNVPGCPVNPDWLYLTVAQYIANAGTLVASLDADSRPTQLLGQQLYYLPVHSGNCINYQAYCDGIYATSIGQEGKCLMMLGCLGPSTASACSKGDQSVATTGGRLQDPKWNDVNDVSSGSKSRAGACINAGAPCIGCTEKNFPYNNMINY